MQTTADAFRTFEDLEVYQAARVFRKAMYGVRRRLPEYEKFKLASQMRKAGEAGVLHESFADYHTEDETDPFADLPL